MNYPLHSPSASKRRAMNPALVDSDPSFSSFGQYLWFLRRQMEISGDAVAGHLRISRKQLAILEAENHDALPAPARVIALLRAYAAYIGVDADDIEERYHINRAMYEKNQGIAFSRNRLGLRIVRAGLLAGIGGMAAVLIVVFIYAGLEWSEGFSRHDPEAKRASGPRKVTTAFAAQPPETGAPVIAAAGEALPAAAEKLLLQIDATEKTDLQIIVDDAAPLTYGLQPMDHIELEAASAICLRLDNAGGVDILLNGAPVDIPGKTGDPVTLELP